MQDWRKQLDKHFEEKKHTRKAIREKQDALRQEAKKFMKKVVLPAFEDLKDELGRHKRDCAIDAKKDCAALVVRKSKRREFVYEVNLSSDDDGLLASKSVYLPNEKGKLKLSVEGKIRNPDNALRPASIGRTDVIADFLEDYQQATRFIIDRRARV